MRCLALCLLAFLASCSGGGGATAPQWSTEIAVTHPQLAGTWQGAAAPNAGSVFTVTMNVSSNPSDASRMAALLSTNSPCARTIQAQLVANGTRVHAAESAPRIEFDGTLDGYTRTEGGRTVYRWTITGTYRLLEAMPGADPGCLGDTGTMLLTKSGSEPLQVEPSALHGTLYRFDDLDLIVVDPR